MEITEEIFKDCLAKRGKVYVSLMGRFMVAKLIRVGADFVEVEIGIREFEDCQKEMAGIYALSFSAIAIKYGS